ncbi:MAG: type II secretion system protein [Clostridiales bacterium]|nr:type II secretion system protein [Clostridiales bacterium]
MKQIQKTKRGFTLVEMVLVIAIIVILATVMLAGVAKYLKYAKTAAEDLDDHIQSTNSISAEIEHQVVG